MSERVLVVGAGVSGCACAAALAARGVPVTVISSSLDVVGQPSFEAVVPVAPAGWGRVARVLDQLPRPLRDVWLAGCFAPVPGDGPGSEDRVGGFFCVDGRMLSIETKRALEQMTGLEFRQGLVRDLWIEDQVVVETAFGELIKSRAVVLAVGLGLGGQVAIGNWALPGGRYGETPGEGLRAAVERLGARLAYVQVKVGPRLSFGAGTKLLGEAQSHHPQEVGAGRMARDGQQLGGEEVIYIKLVPLGERLVQAGALSAPDWREQVWWPEDYPPALHWDVEARSGMTRALAVARPKSKGSCGEPGFVLLSVLTPEGVATGEWYVCPEEHLWANGVGDEKFSSGQSRPGCTVSGWIVQGLSGAGRLACAQGEQLPVWVTGRAAGASDYLESLLSGVRTAEEVAREAENLGLG